MDAPCCPSFPDLGGPPPSTLATAAQPEGLGGWFTITPVRLTLSAAAVPDDATEMLRRSEGERRAAAADDADAARLLQVLDVHDAEPAHLLRLLDVFHTLLHLHVMVGKDPNKVTVVSGHRAAAGGARELDRNRMADDLRATAEPGGCQQSVGSKKRILRRFSCWIGGVRRRPLVGRRAMSASRMMTYSAVGLACSSLEGGEAIV